VKRVAVLCLLVAALSSADSASFGGTPPPLFVNSANVLQISLMPDGGFNVLGCLQTPATVTGGLCVPNLPKCVHLQFDPARSLRSTWDAALFQAN
jgi:hypothetical protein